MRRKEDLLRQLKQKYEPEHPELKLLDKKSIEEFTVEFEER